MPKATKVLVLTLSLLLVGCSGGSKAEKDSKSASDEAESARAETGEQMEAAESTSAKAELAACTGGNVPKDADKCLLDLGTGKDSYWSDSDGVDPSTAGCHLEHETEACETMKEGRTFGEFCLDDDRLVESNPAADECHTHKGDLGKPDVVSCSEWCQSEQGTSGSCESGVTANAGSVTCESARCVCN